jgi:[ribosomal protein S5]-alanine N-acetyltransferase
MMANVRPHELHPLALQLPQSSGSTRLRQFRPSDLPRFVEYRADPRLAEHQSWEPMSHEAAASFLSEMTGATHFKPGDWVQLAVADVATDELIGDVGLFSSEDRTFAELGFTLAKRAQGKGHATRAAELAVEQAFRVAELLEVRAVTDQLNHPSVATLGRAKFVQTGTRAAVFKGKPCVEVLFARRRGEA